MKKVLRAATEDDNDAYLKNLAEAEKCLDKARKINRFIGFEMVIMGILFIISAFLKPVATLVCIILLIPYAIISFMMTKNLVFSICIIVLQILYLSICF